MLEKLIVVCSKLNYCPALLTMKRSLHSSAMKQGFVAQVEDLKVQIVILAHNWW